MYTLNAETFDIDHFLAEIWQQKPVIIKQGFSNFIDPLSADELAGLAGEEHIESRLITNKDNHWQLSEGPITEFASLGAENWTLVVQSVNHWHSAADALSKAFGFIPQWRFDDVMVSFACTGGGVGPHVDNYDVFICQGSGKRRWQVGAKGSLEEVLATPKLRHVKAFQPMIDEVVEAGDIVYIPPGFPHCGISLDNSMSFSVGYQAVKDRELFSHFADFLLDNSPKNQLFCDSKRKRQPYSQISNTDISQLQTLATKLIADKTQFADFLGCYFSQSFHELDIVSSDYDTQEWDDQLSNFSLKKLNAVKFLHLENNSQTLYVNGEVFQFVDIDQTDLQQLCEGQTFSAKNLKTLLKKQQNKEKLIELTNLGYFYFE